MTIPSCPFPLASMLRAAALAALLPFAVTGCSPSSASGDGTEGPRNQSPDASDDASGDGGSGMNAADAASRPDGHSSGVDAGGLDGSTVVFEAATGCTGTPDPCSILPQSQCAGVAGCSYAGGCSGLSEGCYLFNGNSYSCSSQQGCYYDSSTMNCLGSSFSCSTITTDLGCVQQQGCNWTTPMCSGTPIVTCAALSQTLCTSVPGCSWL